MPERSYLSFPKHVQESFAFLNDLGFSEVETLPTLVRYRKGDIEVDVYHGRRSYEIGAGVSVFGTRYAISEIIRALDSERYKRFRYPAMTTPEGVAIGVEEIGSLMRRYGAAALQGDRQFFLALDQQRKLSAREYALDVLAFQLRPKAYEAFKRRDYSTAADLYARIRGLLSPVEIRKLSIAEKRGKN